jgi:ApbE superfamily uncharacterized protein (UPF0280 family)
VARAFEVWLHSVERQVPMILLVSDYLAVVVVVLKKSDTTEHSWPTTLTWVDSVAADDAGTADAAAAVLGCDVPSLIVAVIELLPRADDHYKMAEAAVVVAVVVLASEQRHL